MVYESKAPWCECYLPASVSVIHCPTGPRGFSYIYRCRLLISYPVVLHPFSTKFPSMIIADKLKQTNRAEYLLYLWQVEDLLRVYDCNEDRIRNEYLSQFQISDDQRARMAQWYADLCEMMRSEGKRVHGHLQLCCNILQELTELHNALLRSSHFPYYREMYYKVLPYIVELRSKSKTAPSTADEAPANGCPDEPELETCFDFLYGLMVLRLQGKTVSESTQRAAKDVSTLLGQLSDYYFKDKAEPLEL